MHSTALSLAVGRPETRRILIVDRNAVNRRSLRAVLDAKFPNLVVTECDSLAAATLLIERGSIDAVLLDSTSSDCSSLSDLTGAGTSAAFIVITTMKQLARAVNDYSAADYLIRPFNSDRLSLAMHRAFARADERRAPMSALARGDAVRPIRADMHSGSRASDVVLPAAASNSYRRRFLISIGTRDVVVHADALAWVRANGYCATLVLRDRREYLVRLPLDQLETELDPDEFIRIHRSAIVRFQELQELERSASRSVRAVLRSGTRIPVSRSRRDALIRALGGI